MRPSALMILLVASTARLAAADTFGGFSAVDRPYLVNQDRACTPLLVAEGKAAGVPACTKVTADVLAHLDVKPPVAQSGATKALVATASGRVIVVASTAGDAVVTWEAPDPVGKVIEVYSADGDDRIAVTYTVRRAGRELTDVVGFDLIAHAGRPKPGPTPTTPTPTMPTPTTPPVVAPPPVDPAVAKAVDAARKAAKPRAAAAWQAVLALDADHSEARYQLAAIAGAAKQPAEALARLAQLAASSRPDAIEFLVDARFDGAFAALRADPKFRAAVGLDRKAGTAYERFMGFGGQWEQTGTACDKAEVHLVARRDRTFKLRVKTACEGQVFDLPFHGVWRTSDVGVILTLPTTGKAASAQDEAPCTFESATDEDALHCTLGKDIDFVVLPTRR